jgi:aminoglycoside 6'-N-acetyltransferase
MHITFELLQKSHFSLLLKWLETSHVKKYWDQDINYTTELINEKYLSYVHEYKLQDGLKKLIKAFIIYANQNPVGYIQIYNAYDFPRDEELLGLPQNLGAFDIFIGELWALKQNLGSKALSKFLKFYGNEYSHIFADPDKNNMAAIKCYLKSGFKIIDNHKKSSIWMLKELIHVRLSDHDFESLKSCFRKYFLDGDKLWLFGSRADLNKKGGDIDLYIETYAKTIDDAVKMESSFLFALQDKIGEQKIDIVLNMINNPYPISIHDIAKKTGVRII